LYDRLPAVSGFDPEPAGVACPLNTISGGNAEQFRVAFINGGDIYAVCQQLQALLIERTYAKTALFRNDSIY
jgi:hypothetical protein